MSTWQEKFGSGRSQSLKRKVTDWCNFTWMWLNPIDLVFPRPIFLGQLSVSDLLSNYRECLTVSFKAELLLHLLLFGKNILNELLLCSSIYQFSSAPMVAYLWTKSHLGSLVSFIICILKNYIYTQNAWTKILH